MAICIACVHIVRMSQKVPVFLPNEIIIVTCKNILNDIEIVVCRKIGLKYDRLK